jgi:hypothetical protein
MIGATDDNDALKQAARSTDDTIDAKNLQRWNGQRYE